MHPVPLAPGNGAEGGEAGPASIALAKGSYRARTAADEAGIRAAQALRARCFGLDTSHDADPHDAECSHVVIDHVPSGRIVCCYRLRRVDRRTIGTCYAAQHYALDALEAYDGKMLELGRFCIAPECTDPDVLRLAWAALTDYVDREDVGLLFGCSSFAGVEPGAYLDAFADLRARHLAPDRWQPGIRASEVFRFGADVTRVPDRKRAAAQMPPLLRTYLLMGGWVSDHAVVDREMNTLHVFTGVEVGAIPESRKRLLRALV